MTYFVYIAASDAKRLATGITTDLEVAMGLLRDSEEGWISGTRPYKLVYFREFHSMREAIAHREDIEQRSPKRRCDLIDETNPDWTDLLPGMVIFTTKVTIELDDLWRRVAQLEAKLREMGIDPDQGSGGCGALLKGWPDFPRPRIGAEAAEWPVEDWIDEQAGWGRSKSSAEGS